MYCRNCGNENINDSMFCQYCGADLSEYERHQKRHNNIIIFLATLFLVILCGVIVFLLFQRKMDNSTFTGNNENVINTNNFSLNNNNIDNSYISNSDDIHYYISNLSDGSYSIKQIYYYNGDDGSYISNDDKFWVRADHQDSNGDISEKYILIDITGTIYNMIPTNKSINDIPIDMLFSVSENVIMLCQYNSYHIVDITDSSKDNCNFTDITSQYLNNGEYIWTVQYDDSGINIFTISLVDTYSYQDIIFNVYDSSMDLKFSFSKSELSDKYGIWRWDNDNLNIESLGNCIYGIKASNNGSHDDLYIDTKRQKAFINETVFTNMYFNWSSNGYYILCTGGYSGDDYLLINIDEEDVEYHNTIEIPLSDIGESSRISSEVTLRGFSDVSENFCYAYALYGANQHYVLLQFQAVAVNSILDYSGSKVTNFSEFHDGYSILELENSGGTKFITMILNNGEWQFEPIAGCIDNGVYYFNKIRKYFVFSNDLNCGYLIGDNGLEQEVDNISINDTFFHIADCNNKYQIVCLDNISNSLKYIDID